MAVSINLTCSESSIFIRSESFNKLKSLDTANLIFEHKDIADFLKLEFDGSNNQIIFYPENIIEKNLINKMKMKIIDFSDDRILFDWCNKYIFQIVTSVIFL